MELAGQTKPGIRMPSNISTQDGKSTGCCCRQSP